MDSKNGSHNFKINIENDLSKQDLTSMHLAAVQQCRELSCKQNPPIDDLTARDIVPVLVNCLLQDGNPELQLEAARVLKNIAGTSVQRHEIVNAGALPPLIELLKAPCDDVRQQALWILDDIVDYDVEICNRVIELGVMEQLPSLVKTDSSIQFLRIVAAVILKLFRCVNSLPSVKTIQATLLTLNELITHSDNEILRDTVQTIVLLLAGALPRWDRIQLVIKTGIVPKLIPLLIHGDEVVQRAALEAVRDILSGTVEQKQVVLDCGVLSYFPALLSHQDEKNIHSAQRALSFLITSRNKLHCQAVVDADLLPKIVEVLSNERTAGVTTVYSLSAFGNEEHVASLINYGAIPLFCKLMTCEDKDIVNVVCLSLQYILKKAGKSSRQVATQIKALKKEQTEDGNAFHIIEKDFAGEETEKLVKEVISELENIAVCLTKNLSQIEENRKFTDFRKLLNHAANTENSEFQFAAVEEFKKFISSDHCEESQIDDYIEIGLLPVLVQVLSQDDIPELQLEAATTFINIAAGTSAQTHKVVEAGAVPVLIELLKSPSDDVSEHALWALGNIIEDGPELCNRVIELGVAEVLLNLSKSVVPVKVLRRIAWLIEILCGKDVNDPLSLKLIHEIIPVLYKFIVFNDCEAIKVGLSAINCLFESGDLIKRVQLVIDSDIVAKVIPLLSHGDEDLQKEASKAICYIVKTEDLKQVAIDCDALSHFLALMSHQNKTIKRNAVCTLANILAGNERQKQAVIEAGLLPKILEQLAKEETNIQRAAASALYNLSINGTTEQVAALIGCGVIPQLCNLLTCAETRVVITVLNGLSAILKNFGEETKLVTNIIEKCGGVDKIEALQFHETEEVNLMASQIIKRYWSGEISTNNEIESLSISEIKKLVNIAANADNPADQLTALQLCRKLSAIDSKEHPLIDPLIDSGILPILINCLSSDQPTLQSEAALSLLNIVSGTSDRQQDVVSAGAVPPLIKLLKSPHDDVSERAAVSLVHMIGDSPVIRDFVIELGLVDTLLSFVKEDTRIPFLISVIWVMASLFRGEAQLPPAKAIHKILPAFNDLIMYSNTKVKFVTSMAIANLLNGDQHYERIQLVIESGIVAELTSLLAHEDEEVQHVALLIISKIATGTEEQKQVVLDCGALSHFPALLSHPKKQICKHAVLILSNITIGKEYHIQAVIDAGLLVQIVEHLGEGPLDTQNNATWVVYNASNNGTTEQVVALISCGVIPALCNLLPDLNLQMVHNVLESLSNMLKKARKLVASEIEECGGVDRIEALKSHHDVEISKKASHIMKKYFDGKISWWRCCYARRVTPYKKDIKDFSLKKPLILPS